MRRERSECVVALSLIPRRSADGVAPRSLTQNFIGARQLKNMLTRIRLPHTSQIESTLLNSFRVGMSADAPQLRLIGGEVGHLRACLSVLVFAN
jgi:hypothetical protein